MGGGDGAKQFGGVGWAGNNDFSVQFLTPSNKPEMKQVLTGTVKNSSSSRQICGEFLFVGAGGSERERERER